MRAGPREARSLGAEAEAPLARVENAKGSGGDLRTDAVAADNADAIWGRLHAVRMVPEKGRARARGRPRVCLRKRGNDFPELILGEGPKRLRRDVAERGCR